MKGIVLSVKRGKFSFGAHHHAPRIHSFSIKRFLSFYGVHSLFFVVLVLGVVLGSFTFSNASEDLLKRLDFLFITNLENRLVVTEGKEMECDVGLADVSYPI